MEIGVISTRYAKALLKYTCENKTEDRVYKEMQLLAKNLYEIPELRNALDNPIIPLKQKISLVYNAGGIDVSDEYRRFIELVFHKRREKFLFFISIIFLDLYHRLKNITIGKLTTAYPVDKATEERMKNMVKRVTHGSVEFETRIDPGIEGGFIFDVGTYRIDGSIVNRFRKVKKQFIERNRRIV